jgi:dephospho-CoA kinase
MVIGVTGPVAAGKSLAVRFLETRGFTAINADMVGHALLKKSRIRARLKKIFGAGFFHGHDVDRRKLGDLVFRDAQSRKKLDAVMHPEITREIRKKLAGMKGRNVVIDAALLFGLGLAGACDKTILITASRKIILKRMRSRGLKGAPVRALGILRAQASQQKYWKKCDYKIDNSGTYSQLKQSLKKVLS